MIALKEHLKLRQAEVQAALDQRMGDETLEILGRLPLHARRDFLAEKFEQKIGHKAAYSSLCEPSQSGSFLVCLQPQKNALPVASAL